MELKFVTLVELVQNVNTIHVSLKNIVAIKDDFCGAFSRKMSLLAHESWAVVSGGQKQNHLNNQPYGCDGYLSTYQIFKPSVARLYWECVIRSDIQGAVSVIEKYDMPLFDLITGFDGGFDAGIHGALEIFGLAERWRRKPYVTIGDEEYEKLQSFFASQPGIDAAV